MRIKSITLDFPNADAGNVIFYTVGVTPRHSGISKPVTEIRKAERFGEWGMIPYYEIYTEDGIIAEMHQYGHIVYFQEGSS